MDSMEILSAIEEATTSEGLERVTLNKDTRYELAYSSDTLFENPLVIRGTNRQLFPFSNMVSFSGGDMCQVNEVVRMCENIDNNLDINTIETISNLTMTFVNDSYILLFEPTFNDGNGMYWLIPTPHGENKKESVAFRKWSELLKIPYSYAKKSPGHLNKANFEYWKNMLTVAQDQMIPIDIIYLKESVEVTLEDGQVIKAYVAVNILRSEVVYENKDVIYEIIHSELHNRVPLMSKILDNVKTQIQECSPDVKIKVQQYSLGYTGLNKGRHYARLVLDHPKFSFEVDGETMFPAITIESDFLGRCKDFEEVIITFSLFREVCSNGVVVNWNEQQKKLIRDQFVTNYLTNRGVSSGDQNYVSVSAEAQSQFSTIFSSNGLKIPVNIANITFPSSPFKQMFNFFLGTLGYMKTSLKELNSVKFEDVPEKMFVSTVHNVAGSMNISTDITKYLIIEYISGNTANQEQFFNTPLDVLNFITFVSKVYNSTIQLDIEKKAYAFAHTLMQILIHKHKIDESIYENYSRQINRDIL